MSEKYQPPPGPPPNFRSQSQSDIHNNAQEQNEQRQRERVSWTVGGGPSTHNHGLGSNNPFREGSVNPAQHQQRPSSLNLASSAAAASTPGPSPFLSAPLPQPTSSKASSDVEMGDDEYMPPSGPPPGHTPIKSEYESPPGRPSILSPEPPPYDPWLGPDDSLRPPPSFSNVRPQDQKSPAANADYDEAARAHAWCRQNALWAALDPDPYWVERIEAGDLRLTVPPNTTDVTQYQPAMGQSYIRTSSNMGDTILLSDIPIYTSQKQSPLSTGRPQTLYFEVRVLGIGDRYGTGKQVESGIGIGFVAPPYPAWRLPGWHRGSLGVHSDDGRRYVDNSYGGRDFTSAFQKGETVGIGMTFDPPVHGDRVSMRCQVFFTRNGKKDGIWDLHEEQDMEADEGDIRGLEGEHDILAAVGVFGEVEFECIFRRGEWMFKP